MNEPKIFVVDDDRDFAEGLADVLELRGYEVDLAFSGEEAIAKFKENDYDITFMDVRLPGMNGVESLRTLRRLKPGARVVMMTGYSVPQLLDEALDEGAWAVLQKPFDMEQVLEMVRQIPPTGVVLIADDDPDFAAGCKDLFDSAGYRTCVVPDGEQAVEQVKSGRSIDLLVLDIRLPIMNGLEVLMAVREAGYELSTIVVTAYPDEESDKIDILTDQEVTGVLVKPFDPEDLLAAVGKWAERPPPSE
jgi:DNA-binding response OmpR family regulator